MTENKPYEFPEDEPYTFPRNVRNWQPKHWLAFSLMSSDVRDLSGYSADAPIRALTTLGHAIFSDWIQKIDRMKGRSDDA